LIKISFIDNEPKLNKTGGRMKRIIFIISLILAVIPFCCAAEQQEPVLEHIIFKDYPAMGGAITENPLKTTLILGGIAGTTALLINNDLWLSKGISKYHDKTKDTIFDIANYGGDGLSIMAAAAVFYALDSPREKEFGAKLLEGLAVSGLTGYVVKTLAGRERPSQTENQFSFWHVSFSDMSFPSGHTSTAFMWATMVPEHYGRWLYFITYPAAATVAAARVYKQKHWVSDTFAGAALGIFSAFVVDELHDRLNAEIAVEHGYGINYMTMKYRF